MIVFLINITQPLYANYTRHQSRYRFQSAWAISMQGAVMK
ncbi:hypothetical protein CPS_4900 [Colwellia psychrerythraea 34H]|uniref:Uncharacterized protein n=1 Tax=Colwellia psychrerythraea (strain 34H / ATCC BAA-681) TaxID=167879 RepID=Q47UI4_COLP3|nr:hypothetical protein CPS_4900 [Colwellia psychrerythraea 34H]